VSAVPAARASSRPTRLHLQGLRKSFGETVALHQFELETREGEFISLLGPSGCGKTTTLRCIAGFEMPDSGRVLLDGMDITELPPERRDIGMVFQNYALFPHLTVRENLSFGLEMRRVGKTDADRRIAGMLEMVQLGQMADRYPRQLSGGQQQRVALARALVIEPRLLLLDEPLANLDAVLREDMRVFIRELQQRVGITAMYVTHDQSEAMVMSDRVAVILGGKLQQFDTPESIYLRPRSADVARFIGRANVIAAKVCSRRAVRGTFMRYQLETPCGLVEAECDTHLADGQAVQVAVRPEALRFAHDGAALQGVVQGAWFLGSAVEHSVQCAGGLELRMHSAPADRLTPGTRIGVEFDPSQAWIMADATP
jgi:putative spermidine/putrescine transport system ATP-binding protein